MYCAFLLRTGVGMLIYPLIQHWPSPWAIPQNSLRAILRSKRRTPDSHCLNETQRLFWVKLKLQSDKNMAPSSVAEWENLWCTPTLDMQAGPRSFRICGASFLHLSVMFYWISRYSVHIFKSAANYHRTQPQNHAEKFAVSYCYRQTFAAFYEFSCASQLLFCRILQNVICSVASSPILKTQNLERIFQPKFTCESRFDSGKWKLE